MDVDRVVDVGVDVDRVAGAEVPAAALHLQRVQALVRGAVRERSVSSRSAWNCASRTGPRLVGAVLDPGDDVRRSSANRVSVEPPYISPKTPHQYHCAKLLASAVALGLLAEDGEDRRQRDQLVRVGQSGP